MSNINKTLMAVLFAASFCVQASAQAFEPVSVQELSEQVTGNHGGSVVVDVDTSHVRSSTELVVAHNHIEMVTAGRYEYISQDWLHENIDMLQQWSNWYLDAVSK